MDLDTKAVRETILWFIDLAYKASNEAVAHEVALAFLKAADPAAGRIFDQFLEQSRKNPSPLLHARYQEEGIQSKNFCAKKKSMLLWNS